MTLAILLIPFLIVYEARALYAARRMWRSAYWGPGGALVMAQGEPAAWLLVNVKRAVDWLQRENWFAAALFISWIVALTAAVLISALRGNL